MQWVKHGRVFNPSVDRRPWYSTFGQAPATLILEDRVRVYFSARPQPDAHGQFVSYTGFLDLDREDLTAIRHISENPILDLGGIGAFDEFGIYPTSVIEDGDRLRAYYGGWTRCVSVPFNVAIGLAESMDGGQTFQRVGKGPVLSYSPEEPFVISGPKIRRFGEQWLLYYIAGRQWVLDNGHPEPVYKIRMAVSDDGIHWVKENRDLIEPRLGELEAQASPDVQNFDGSYHMFFCYRHGTDYRNGERGYRIGYAFSSNGFEWQRADDQAGITVSDEGWDSEMVCYPHVFALDDRIYMLYIGNGVGREGFGLAELVG